MTKQCSGGGRRGGAGSGTTSWLPSSFFMRFVWMEIVFRHGFHNLRQTVVFALRSHVLG